MRARNIKPGFFANEYLAELDPYARLLFIGLWTLADRCGRLEDRPKRIKAEVFPYEDVDADALLESLAGSPERFIERYSVDGAPYIQIANFLKHQNPHKKEAPSSIPPPSGENENLLQSMGEHHTSTMQAPYKHHASTGVSPTKDGASPADSGFLIPDSGFRIPERGLLIAEKDGSSLPLLLSEKIPGMRPQDFQTIISFQEGGMQDDTIALAVDMAVQKGKPGFGFVRYLLNEWLLNEVKTADAAREYERKKFDRSDKPIAVSGIMTRMEDYVDR